MCSQDINIKNNGVGEEKEPIVFKEFIKNYNGATIGIKWNNLPAWFAYHLKDENKDKEVNLRFSTCT